MKQTLSTIAIIFLLLFSTGIARAADLRLTFGVKNTVAIPKDSVDAIAIQKRVQEIQAMNVSELTTAQRRTLRNELKGMYNQLRNSNNDEGGGHSTYIVISGGLIIVILLLILILR